jgi:hypothetical protein
VAAPVAPERVDRSPRPAESFGATEDSPFECTFDPAHMPSRTFAAIFQKTRFQPRSGAVGAPHFRHATMIADPR